jgi:hypothetical protein
LREFIAFAKSAWPANFALPAAANEPPDDRAADTEAAQVAACSCWLRRSVVALMSGEAQFRRSCRSTLLMVKAAVAAYAVTSRNGLGAPDVLTVPLGFLGSNPPRGSASALPHAAGPGGPP